MLDNKDHNEDAIDAFYRQKANGYQVSPVPDVFGAILGKTSLAANDPIDSFYKEKSQGYTLEASPNAFEQIMSKTTLPQNSPSSLLKPFKIGGMIVGVGAVTIAAWFGFSNKDKENSTPTNHHKNTSTEYVQPKSVNEILPKTVVPTSNDQKKEIIEETKKQPKIEVTAPITKPTNYSNDVSIETPTIIPKIEEVQDNVVNDEVIDIELETPKVAPSKKSIIEESDVNSITHTESKNSVKDNFSQFKNKHNKSDSTQKLFTEKEKK